MKQKMLFRYEGTKAISAANDCKAAYSAVAYRFGLQDGIKLAFEMKEFEYPYMQKDIFKEKVSFCQIGVISYFTRVMFCLRNDDFRACIVSVIIISSWLEQSSSI